MQSLSQRSAGFRSSTIRRMTRLCNEVGAVNLSQGFPDFEPPQVMLDRLAQVARENYNQYAVTWGAPNFCEALAAKQQAFMSWGVAPDAVAGAKAEAGLPAETPDPFPVDPDAEVCVMGGATEAMLATMLSLLDAGDRVVAFTPAYENYAGDAALAQAQVVYVPLRPPSFDFDASELEAALAGEAFDGYPATRDGRPAKILVVNTPSNPCGKVFTRDELQVIARLVQKYDVFAVTDEVYEHIVFAPARHVSLATLPGMRERTITVSSISKTLSATGWRIGYTIAPAAITERIKLVHDYITCGAPAPLMEAAVPGLLLGQDYYDGLDAMYAAKRALVLGGLDELGIAHNDPAGAFYVLMDISEFGYESDLAFAEDLARKVGVGGVPCSYFFGTAPDGTTCNRYVRLHFAKRDETLRAALERLASLRERIPAR